MTAITDFLENELLDHVLTNTAYTQPATVYASLFTTLSAGNIEADTGTEATGSAYARTAITFGTPAASGSISSTADCTFPTASGGNWGTIVGMMIEDASTAGNALFGGTLTASKVVNDGDTFKFNSGDITVTLD